MGLSSVCIKDVVVKGRARYVRTPESIYSSISCLRVVPCFVQHFPQAAAALIIIRMLLLLLLLLGLEARRTIGVRDC